MIDLISQFRSVLKIDISFTIIPYPDHYPADEPLRRCPNLDKARKELGYEPKTKLLDGLKKTYEWAQIEYNSL